MISTDESLILLVTAQHALCQLASISYDVVNEILEIKDFICLSYQYANFHTTDRIAENVSFFALEKIRRKIVYLFAFQGLFKT